MVWRWWLERHGDYFGYIVAGMAVLRRQRAHVISARLGSDGPDGFDMGSNLRGWLRNSNGVDVIRRQRHTPLHFT